MDSQLRSIVKTITYRTAAIIGTLILVWFITKDIGETTFITFTVHILLTVIYYFHERIWNKVKWGTVKDEN